MAARIILIVAFLVIVALWICVGLLSWELKRQRGLIRALKMGKFEEAVHNHMNVEQRCQHCRDKDECPAYDTGVIYPCGYYQAEEEQDGTEE